MEIVAAHPADEPAIRELLDSSGLPTADIDARSLPDFLVLREDGALAGAVALEPAGEVALLRSLVVSPAARHGGRGGALVAAAEALAARRGIRELYLLTTTAQAFFAARGYRVADRAQAPPAIRSTTQFRSLCPASAVLMTRHL